MARRRKAPGGPAAAQSPAAHAPEPGTAWWIKALVLALPVAVVAAFAGVMQMRERPAATAAAPHGPMGAAASAPQAAPAAAGDRTHMGDEEIRQMAARLAARLEREPNDAAGWRMLARTWYVLKQFPDAARAYERLATLAPIEDAEVLADYADTLAMVQGGDLAGRPMELVRAALAKNPEQWKALSMSATDAFRRGDAKLAAANWERALKTVPPDSEVAEGIRASLAQARR